MARSISGVVVVSKLNLALRAISILLIALACAACAASQVHQVTDYCTPWRPIYTSRADVLTDGTAKAILQHDETGAKLCGWQPNPTKEK